MTQQRRIMGTGVLQELPKMLWERRRKPTKALASTRSRRVHLLYLVYRILMNVARIISALHIIKPKPDVFGNCIPEGAETRCRKHEDIVRFNWNAANLANRELGEKIQNAMEKLSDAHREILVSGDTRVVLRGAWTCWDNENGDEPSSTRTRETKAQP